MRKVLYILGQLLDADLQWLVNAGQALDLEVGASLIRQDEPIESLFVVVDGELSVQRDGHQLARLGAGEVVGEMSFLDGKLPSATVLAASPSRVHAVPRERLRAKLDQDSAFAARFYRALCVFLAGRLDRTDALIGADARVAPEREAPLRDGLSPQALEHVALAGARFDWFLEQLKDPGARA